MSKPIDARNMVLYAHADQEQNLVAVTFVCRSEQDAVALQTRIVDALLASDLSLTLPGGAVPVRHEGGSA